MQGWIGVDLDGTLAFYDDVWRGVKHIGEPLMPMIERVKAWLADGRDVRIFTARVGPQPDGQRDLAAEAEAREAIYEWCLKHIGRSLPITATKDYAMRELWDDRCVQVISNTGMPIVAPEISESEARKGR